MFASVCMPAGSVCAATRMCGEHIEMHRCQLCPTLLHRTQQKDIIKGNTSRILSAEWQKRHSTLGKLLGNGLSCQLIEPSIRIHYMETEEPSRL